MEETLTGFVEGEDVLEDDYPVYGDYIYLVDGIITSSNWHDITVREFKLYMKAEEIRNCRIYHPARKNARIGDKVA